MALLIVNVNIHDKRICLFKHAYSQLLCPMITTGIGVLQVLLLYQCKQLYIALSEIMGYHKHWLIKYKLQYISGIIIWRIILFTESSTKYTKEQLSLIATDLLLAAPAKPPIKVKCCTYYLYVRVYNITIVLAKAQFWDALFSHFNINLCTWVNE